MSATVYSPTSDISLPPPRTASSASAREDTTNVDKSLSILDANNRQKPKIPLNAISDSLAALDRIACEPKRSSAVTPLYMDALSGPSGMADLRLADPLADVEQRLEHYRGIDAQREDLVLALVRQLHELRNTLTRLQDDHENERESRQTWQKKAREQEQLYQRVKQYTDLNAFVVALIDGDGAPFLDALIQARGESGGEEAAHKMKETIARHMQSRNDIPSGCYVLVKIYANFAGLADTLQKLGIISSPQTLTNFFRGFTHGQHLFDFIDVGPGKERADFKLKENFNLFLGHAQCKHIYLGGICHDNGYLNMLAPYGRDANVTSRVTLLQTYDRVQAVYKTSGFDIIRATDVFRQQELESPSLGFARPLVAPTGSAGESSSLAGSKSWNLKSPNSPTVASHGAPPGLERSNTRTPTGAVSSAGSASGGSEPGKGFRIYLNRDGRRLDPPVYPPVTESAAWNIKDRIRNEGRLCNRYHLQENCRDGDYCRYVHGERLTGAELSVLAGQARTTPCGSGSDCRTWGCTQGHMCPAKKCTYGSDCKFPPELHRENMNMVAERRLYENGVIQAVNMPIE